MARLFENAEKGISRVTPGKFNREEMFQNDIIRELNTYDTWGEIPIPGDMNDLKLIRKDGKIIQDPNAPMTYGVRSIFNRHLLVPYLSDGLRITLNTPLIDSPETRKRIKAQSNPTIKNLVAASVSGQLGRETYSYSDFMYCK